MRAIFEMPDPVGLSFLENVDLHHVVVVVVVVVVLVLVVACCRMTSAQKNRA